MKLITKFLSLLLWMDILEISCESNVGFFRLGNYCKDIFSDRFKGKIKGI